MEAVASVLMLTVKTALNVWSESLSELTFSFFLGKHPGVGWLGHAVGGMFNFLRNF